jgi:hypothetical protein
MGAIMSTELGTVPWVEVYPDDQVVGADGAIWVVTDRELFGPHVRVTIVREGRDPISRADPPGSVRCRRGDHGRTVAATVATFRGCGFTVQ